MTGKPRVLFVCLGNACRSQMAEGFARAYGGDVMEPLSAGLAPYSHVPEETRVAMIAKSIDVSRHFPKAIEEFDLPAMDLIVNMSGSPFPVDLPNLREWDVRDPFGRSDKTFLQVRDLIERLVMELIIEIRRVGLGPKAG